LRPALVNLFARAKREQNKKQQRPRERATEDADVECAAGGLR